MRLLPFALVIATALPACTWVKMEPGAGAVQVAQRADDLSGCSKRGEVGVTVKDKVGLYRRNDLKVRDELRLLVDRTITYSFMRKDEDNANTMGRLAGQSMAGRRINYDHLPSFYSDLFELGYEAVGEVGKE